MNEKSQVRGCYNITIIFTPTRKQCRLSPEMNYTSTPAATANNQPASARTLGERDAAGDEVLLNVFRCQLTY